MSEKGKRIPTPQDLWPLLEDGINYGMDGEGSYEVILEILEPNSGESIRYDFNSDQAAIFLILAIEELSKERPDLNTTASYLLLASLLGHTPLFLKEIRNIMGILEVKGKPN